ncbi:unnamed protein product [Spirodela intermedia]|uniref:Uncharacterized protein n=1 Tax=Spirodela intermedia TaxID=51605 RepID=A0A7I8KEV1_SPIIN|nr:unnamed protein product [Spirodela intermedia]
METKVKSIWREIDHYRPIKNLDTQEQNYIMKGRLYKCLMGINLAYETLVNQILAREVVLGIEETNTLARQEENTKNLKNNLKTEMLHSALSRAKIPLY